MSICELGCGRYEIRITDRCGGRQVCDLTSDLAQFDFNRVMDDTSVANVVVNLGGTPSAKCCACIGSMEPWLHAGVIYRDGDLVWGPGPVVNVLEGSAYATIKLRDQTAWLDRRVVHNDYTFTQVDILEIARVIITDAMAPDDPCDLIGSLQIIGTGDPIDFTIEANKKYAGDLLRDLARIGLDYTCVGNVIVLSQRLEFGPFTTLTDNDFQTDIEIEKRGEDAATKWYTVGEAVVGECGGVDPYYGLIEQIADEDQVVDESTADLAACGRLDASNPAPVYVNIPDGAALSTKAPVCFEQLVPGVLMNVTLTETCTDVAVTNRLTAMKVTVPAGGDEQVGVTLAPLGTNVEQTNQGGDF